MGLQPWGVCVTPWPHLAGPGRRQDAEATDPRTPGLWPRGQGKLPGSLEKLVLGPVLLHMCHSTSESPLEDSILAM